MKSKIRKLVYVGFAFAHHKNTQGGYHHIQEYIKYDFVIDAQREKEFFEKNSKNLIFRILKRIYLMCLGQGTPLNILKCIFLSITHKNLVFHFIYPENSYKWLHHFLGRTNKIVFTLHQPFSFYVNNKNWISILKKADLIFLVSNNEIESFKKLISSDYIFYVPHGINTDFFTSNAEIQKSNKLLMVGNWLRDFEFSAKVFKRLLTVNANFEINIVCNKNNFKYFTELNVNLLERISDEELLLLYQSSKVVYFPLIEYTANNAILEAAACGSDILISTNSNKEVSNYFSNDEIKIVECDEELVFNILNLKLIDSRSGVNSNLEKIVKAKYSWPIVSRNIEKYIDEYININ